MVRRSAGIDAPKRAGLLKERQTGLRQAIYRQGARFIGFAQSVRQSLGAQNRVGISFGPDFCSAMKQPATTTAC
jgi:hypothetical protein